MKSNELYDIEFTVPESKEELIKAVEVLEFLRDNFGTPDIIIQKAVELFDHGEDNQAGTCAFIGDYIDSLENNKTHDYLVTMYSLDQKRDLRYMSYAYPVGGYSEFHRRIEDLWQNNDRLAYIESNIKYLTEIIDNYDTNRTYKFPSKSSK